MASRNGSVEILVEQGGNFYPCHVTHAGHKSAYVKCVSAAIDDEYPLSDIAALVIDLPALIEAEKKVRPIQ